MGSVSGHDSARPPASDVKLTYDDFVLFPDDGKRHEIIEIANVFRAKIVDVGKNTVTIEATGAGDKLAAMEDLLRAYGIKELARTGKIALSRRALLA